MDYYLIRHPQPHDADGRCYGISDLALAEAASSAALRVRPKLPAAFHLISSPLTRCRLLAEQLGSTPYLEPRLLEMDFGAWEGQRWDAIGPAALDAWIASGFANEAHGGESLEAFQARVHAWWAEERPTPTVVVTHAGVIRLLLAKTQGWPLVDALHYPVPFASVLRLSLVNGIWQQEWRCKP